MALETFTIGVTVCSRSHPEWGRGVVIKVSPHPLGAQAVIEFTSGRIERLPLADLEGRPDPVSALARGQLGEAAAFDLHTLAAALKTEHVRTGALASARLTPLPHQILLVDKILSRNLTAHLIADDVGLGKTVEAGLLYQAHAQRGLAERVLIVTPGGLTWQWQEALENLFGVIFDIFNVDFFDARPETWNRFPRVIASIDALKRNRPGQDGRPGRRDLLADADPWDLVIFDEAHRLSAEETSRGTDRTQNYQLAEVLRGRCRFFYLLTATPHQGKEDRFRHLLRLIDPDAVSNVGGPALDGARLNRLMTRNRKADVTDTVGNKLFRGHRVVPVNCPLTPAEANFYQSLNRYLQEGYGTASSLDRLMQQAVGFVMVTFQKLAASSLAAIQSALAKRRTNLLKKEKAGPGPAEAAERDDRFQGEQVEQSSALQHAATFFADELTMLEELLGELGRLPRDSKVDRLLEEIRRLDHLAASQGRGPEHVLVFTEYRASQDLLVSALESVFGPACCVIIRGGMKLNEKRNAQRQFATTTRFLISTEAGGEGINLQERSHILFNFDLPWNPMRLHQRIGRLDRYGQRAEVIAYNLQRTGTIEDRLRAYLDEKIATIMQALRDLEGDRAEDLREAVLGHLDQELDLTKLYGAAVRQGTDRSSQEEIDKAMTRVAGAARRLTEFYGMLEHFDLQAFHKLEPRFTPADVEAFVQRFLDHRGRRLKDHKDGSFSFLLPDELRQRRLDAKQLDLVVFDRVRLEEHPNARLLGFGDPYFDRMVGDCLRPGFGGETALRRLPRVGGAEPGRGLQFCFLVKRQSAAGEKPVDWDLWSFFIDDQLKAHSELGEKLLGIWSVGTRNQLPPPELGTLCAPANEVALGLVQDRLAAYGGALQPQPIYDAQLVACAEVHFPE